MAEKSKFLTMFEQLSEDEKDKVAQVAILITELIIEKGPRRRDSEPMKEIGSNIQ